MQNDILSGFEVFANVLLPIALSFGASLVRVAKYGWHGLKEYVKDFVICSFMGVIIFWSLDYVDLPPTVDAAITGGASYAGKELLEAFTEKAIALIKGWLIKQENNVK